nr:sigma-70 family RNA polymerase sigma factor [Ktedonobacteraceae bacterium]
MLALTDEELVMRCKRELPGNTRSYEELVQRHMNRVYGIAYRVVNNREEAEDIAQEVFVKVFHNIKKFEQQAAFSSWVYRVATNSALDALDKTRRQTKNIVPLSGQGGQSSKSGTANADNSDPLQQQASSTVSPEDKVIQKELRECINKVLKKLDREQARLLIMRDFDDLSYVEIANALEAGLSAVKMRIHRARLAFQEIFSQFCGSTYLAFSTSPTDGAKSKGKTTKE